MEDFERLRPAGRLEQYSTARHHLKFYYNIAAAGTYTLPDSYGLPAKDYIYKTCESLIQQHPSLSAIPVGEDTKQPYFVRLPEIDLDRAVFFQERQHELPEGVSDSATVEDPDLESLIAVQHNTGFSAPLPFWRLCILTEAANERRFTAVFVYHHALGDGTSGKSFHRTFLKALQEAISLEPDQAKQVISSPTTPLLPTLEEAHHQSITLPYLAGVFFRAKIWPSKDPGLWTGGKVQSPLETQVRHFALSKSLASSLKTVCHEHHTTITALLETVIARALFSHLPSTFSTLRCCTAVSMRRWLPAPIDDDSMGVWVQDFNEFYTRDVVNTSQFPWSEAQRSRKSIESVLKLKGKNATPNLLRFIRDQHQELFLSQLGRKRVTSYELSNIGLGADQAQDQSQPTLGRLVFSQSANIVGGAIQVSVVTGGDGCFALSLTWQKGVVENELIESVVETMKSELNSLGSNN